MASTKRNSTRKSPATSGRRRTGASDSWMTDTTGAIKARPKTSGAITAGLITGIAAGIAGFLAFKRSGKTWDEFSGDIAADVKDRAAAAKTRIKDGIDEARTRADDYVARRKDGVDDGKNQSEIAEEALTLKETGKKTKRPVDDTIATELKTGAVSY